MSDSRARETAAAFGLGAVVAWEGPVAAGRLGRIWRLETPQGRFAVKVTDSPADPDDVARDAAYQDAFHAAGVPMPRVVRTPAGAVLAEVGAHSVRVYTWVDVAGTDRRLDPAAVGRLLATIHAVRIPPDGPVGSWFTDPIGADGWTSVVARLRRAGAPFADRLAALVPAVLDAETLIVPPRDLQVCHRDLWADNLRATPDGGLMALDWENAGPADPGHELGIVVFEYADADPDRARALVRAYEDAGGPARLRTAGDFSMLLAFQGHLAQEGCRRWLAADTDAARADNEAWVAEFLDEPCTRPEVEAMLAALR